MSDQKRSQEATAKSGKQEPGSGLPAELPSDGKTELASSGVPAHSGTAWLPSRVPSHLAQTSAPSDLTRLQPGQQLGDFLIRRVICRGGFAAVYLALQWSLDREVALKVTSSEALPNHRNPPLHYRGEGQHLAQLDHPNIVGVYQQSVEPHTGAQLLCMQYVCGTTLKDLIERLQGRAGAWSGREFLRVIDQLPLPPARLDTDAVVDRQALENADHIETICRLGCQLASALEHAHRRQIFHRDIKPANVLVNRYGRPFLADFNLATTGRASLQSGLIGGTLSYMAPEQLATFLTRTPLLEADAERLGDVYSLGVLLWQTTTGQLPFRDEHELRSDIEWHQRIEGFILCRQQLSVDQWAGSSVFQSQDLESADTGGSVRRESDRSLAMNDSYRMLGQILSKCMSPEPQRRYQSVGAIHRAMDGLAELHAARREGLRLRPSRLVWVQNVSFWKAAQRAPVTAFVLAGLVPQFIASGLQIAYNSTQVVGSFDSAQSAAFVRLIYWANPLIYGSCLLVFIHYFRQILPVWRKLQTGHSALHPHSVAQARRQLLRLPRRVASIAGCGWLAGAILFPGGVLLFGGPLPGSVLLHFLISFLLAGLISVTYSALSITTIILRVFYPRFWLSPIRFRVRARAELRPLDQRLDRITLLAGSIPLIAAAVLILVHPTNEGAPSISLRVLVVLLIIAGGIGYFQSGRTVNSLRRMIHNWLGKHSEVHPPDLFEK